MSLFTSVSGATLTALAGAVAALLTTVSSRRSFRSSERQERDRLRSEVLGLDTTADGKTVAVRDDDSSTAGNGSEESAAEQQPGSGQQENADHIQTVINNTYNFSAEASARLRAGQAQHARFELLLIDYYAFGLTAARRSITVSTLFSVLGGIVLLGGLALAIYQADTNGQVSAAAITSLAGAITSGIGALFHRQAASALKHMEGQTAGLRQDMKAERNEAMALDLLGHVIDLDLQSRLQAAMILKFADATLPDLTPGTEPPSTAAGNGFQAATDAV